MAQAMVQKLAPRHTNAGIMVIYDDDCVRLQGTDKHGGNGVLRLADNTVAVWTGPVTLADMVAFADEWLAQQKDGAA